MKERILPERSRPAVRVAQWAGHAEVRRFAVGCALAVLLAWGTAAAQVLTVDTNGNSSIVNANTNSPVGREYTQIAPTHVQLSKTPLDDKTRMLLIRELEAEQGFALRPFPRGHKGLTLAANGKLEPAGEAYLDMATKFGISASPGARLVITNIKFEHSKIILDFNGGPDPKHRFLRHVQIGMGPEMAQPVVQNDQIPTGTRLTLVFHGSVPELTGDEVEALLAPLISFHEKTPIQAFTDTLPPPLKKAILNHQVLVGMTTQMVRFAKGEPVNRFREQEGQTPYTIWMYGKPPQTVEFVRINGNQVVRVTICPPGRPMEVFTKDLVTPMMEAHGTPLIASNVQIIKEGDVQRNPETQEPAPPPSLLSKGEKLPKSAQNGDGTWGPVYFPPGTRGSGSSPNAGTGQGTGSQASSGNSQSSQAGKSPSTQAPAAQTSSTPAAGTQPASKDGALQANPGNTQQNQ